MRKYVLILVGLFFAAVLAGCGGSDTAATVLDGTQKVSIAKSDVIATGTFTKISVDGAAVTTTTYIFDATTVSWDNGAKSGTWDVVNGDIVITFTDTATGIATTFTFSLIQKESDLNYWLVFDENKKVSRFYLGATNFSPTLMGGAFIGTKPDTLPEAEVTLLSGSLDGTTPGQAGFTFSNSSSVSANAARFNQPLDITYDGSNYFVLDYKNNAIRKIDAATGDVTTLKCISDETEQTPVVLSAPQGITTDGTTLYVADTGNHVIRAVNKTSGVTTVIAGIPATAGAVDNLTAGTNATFNLPGGITTDGTNLYVADTGNHTIRRIQISGTHPVTTLAGSAGNIGSTDGRFSDARFNVPRRLTTDGSRLYVTDFNNRTIRSVEIATGKVTTIAGSAAFSAGQNDSDTTTRSGTSARFYQPWGITTDGASLYVTDFSTIILPFPGQALTDENKFNHLIRRVLIAEPHTVLTIAGGRSYPEAAVVGDKSTARFATPRGIGWDGTHLLVGNGTFSFDTDGLSIFNQRGSFNVILKLPPNLQ